MHFLSFLLTVFALNKHISCFTFTDAPDVNVSIVPRNFTEGANVTLYCIGLGVPAENNYKGLTQMVNGIEIKNTNKPLHGTIQSSIHFQKLRFEDTGTYTCTLNNNIKDIHGILDQTGSKNVIVEGKL